MAGEYALVNTATGHWIVGSHKAELLGDTLKVWPGPVMSDDPNAPTPDGTAWFPIVDADTQPITANDVRDETPQYLFAGDRVLRIHPVRVKTIQQQKN